MSKPDSHRVAIQIPAEEVEALDNWRRKQPRIPPLATAVRQLAMKALENEKADASA